MLQLKKINTKEELDQSTPDGSTPDYLIITDDGYICVATWDAEYDDDINIGCFSLGDDSLYFDEVSEIYEIINI